VSEVGPLVADLFRRSSARTVALLVRALGPAQLDLAEEAVQEAMLRALHVWPRSGVPDAPEAWLVTVARRAALDRLRRGAVRARHAAATAAVAAAEPLAGATLPETAGLDDELALLFLCAHPALPRASRLALVLKEACGFGVDEIAAALLSAPEAVAQRLVRAKRQLRALEAPCEMPLATERTARLSTVLESLALLFNEGYAAHSGDAAVRGELCGEAIRLAESLLGSRETAAPEVHALLALMRFHGSRLAARTDDSGVPLSLAEQDRSRWDRAWIARGFVHLEAAMASDRLTPWHLEAGIASCHAVAEDEASTDWPAVLAFYDQLRALRDSPVVAVNRAVALGFAHGPDAGLAALAELDATRELARYAPLEVARAGLLRRAGRFAEAQAAYRAALTRRIGAAERRFVDRALEHLAQAPPGG